MKVALIQAPVWWTIDPPLGLAQIAGCAKAAGFEVEVFDLNIHLWKDRLPQYETMWLWEQFHFWNQPGIVDAFFKDHARVLEPHLERLLSSDAKVIGFSIGLGSQLASLKLAAMIKAADPSRLVVFGGQYFFRGDKAAELLRENRQVDAVIKGAGDEVFVKLAHDFSAAGSVASLPGVVFRRGAEIVDGGSLEMSRSLDSLPFSDFSGFPLELYSDQDRIPIAASRGCVWACRFCSTREFWTNYSFMSGDRIYAEVIHQRKLYPHRGHVEFYDITANGKPESLARFSRLLIDGRSPHAPIGWKINAILRPEMTRELLFDMRQSGCKSIIYGVESGSPRVLKAMNKNFTIPTAERVLRDTHEAGILATGNFMFGFPGETEEDFELTLDFVRRNHASLDKAYASATFTSLEEHSYLTEHREEFGIKRADDSHHLYWRSEDGRNTYPVRLERYKRFRKACIELGIDAYKGIDGALDQDERANLAQYHEYMDERLSAVEQYLSYLERDPLNAVMRERVLPYRADIEALIPCLLLVERANEESRAGFPSALLAPGRLSRAAAIVKGLRLGGALKKSPEGAEVWWEKERLPSRELLLRLKSRFDAVFDAAPAAAG
ncbi:MAG: B12-binding domain-containing radical SAM protein [Elusimicrobiota bacterium]